ncbi:MAG: TonB-dependent receptor, partial [Betaproteobacteria bacterium]|nr:TonB-dependent receptor [Betaproteobacteria bacterium]
QDSYLARLVDYQTVVTQNLNYAVTPNGLAPSLSNLPDFTRLSNRLRGVNLDSTTRDWSLYFTDTLDLTDKLKISAAGSFNYSTISQSGASKQYLNEDGGYSWTSGTGTSFYNPTYLGAYKSNGLTTALAAPPGAVEGPESNSLDGSHRYQRFNPALGFNYQLDARTGLFGGYSEAMRAPTSVELSCANPQSPCALPTGFNGDPELQAVVSKTVELGARGRWGAKSTWNAAVFDSRLSNDIQFIAAPNSTSFGYFANVGKTERRGFELGAQTSVDKWFLAAQLGHVQALYRSAFTTSTGEAVLSGNTIPGIPRSSFKLRATYAVDPEWLLGAQLIALSSQYAHGNESNADPAGKVAGYSLLNLDAHYCVSPELQISASVSNVFNKQYSTYGLSHITSIYTVATQQFLTPAAPRAVWVGLSYRFGGKDKKS